MSQPGTGRDPTTTLPQDEAAEPRSPQIDSGAGTQGSATTQSGEEEGRTGRADTSGSVSPSLSAAAGATEADRPESTAIVPPAASVPAITPSVTKTITEAPTIFQFSMSKGDMDHDKGDLRQLCERLMKDMHNGTCSLTVRTHNGKTEFDSIEMSGKVDPTLARQYYEEMNKKQHDNTTHIAILASCGALLVMIVCGAIVISRHRKPYCENQQHLTEELQTVENGYHDNPTLEVMEVQPEMQEKKIALNGEFNDSWIVPIDNLLKEDAPDEEDTHL